MERCQLPSFFLSYKKSLEPFHDTLGMTESSTRVPALSSPSQNWQLGCWLACCSLCISSTLKSTGWIFPDQAIDFASSSFHHNSKPNCFYFFYVFYTKDCLIIRGKVMMGGALSNQARVTSWDILFSSDSHSCPPFLCAFAWLSNSVVLFVAGYFPEDHQEKGASSALIIFGRILAVKSETKWSGGIQGEGHLLSLSQRMSGSPCPSTRFFIH